MNRRSFLLASTCTLAFSPLTTIRTASAQAMAVFAVVQAAYSFYQATKSPKSRPDLKLRLILESINQIKMVHARLGGIELALEEILRALGKLPEQTRRIVREELDELTSAQLLGSASLVVEEVTKLSKDFPGQPLSAIPIDRLEDLKHHLRDLKDRRSTIFNRSHLSALAICSAAIVELSAMEFLGESRESAKVTVLSYLEYFGEMEDLKDPESLYSLFEVSQRSIPSPFSKSDNPNAAKTFSSEATLGYFFSHFDLRRQKSKASPSKPTEFYDDSSYRKYLHSYVFSDLAGWNNKKQQLIYYKHYSGKEFTLGHWFVQCGGKGPHAIGCGIAKQGLNQVKYIRQVEHACVDINLDIRKDKFDPLVTYTHVTSFKMHSEISENSVGPNHRLMINKWHEASSIKANKIKDILRGERIEYTTSACDAKYPSIVTSPISELIPYQERSKIYKNLVAEFERGRIEYNQRVSLVETLSAMKQVVTATSKNIRYILKTWGA